MKAKNKKYFHLKNILNLAIELFENGNFHFACFLAITLIEEVGKIIYLKEKDITKSFYNHKKKYLTAVYNTLFVNSRFDKKYKKDVVKINNWLINGEIFNIRNKCLYINRDGIIPEKQVGEDDCRLIICLAGEIFAEIQGYFTETLASEWQKIINEIDEFNKNSKLI